MTYSDDSASPAAPYSGDETGDSFGSPDMVWGSPTTSERVVDTQSGYLVVIKKTTDTRVALSVKRRLGTPPSSFVLLTPDESLKLSKILSTRQAQDDFAARIAEKSLSPEIEEWLATYGNGKKNSTRISDVTRSTVRRPDDGRLSEFDLSDTGDLTETIEAIARLESSHLDHNKADQLDQLNQLDQLDRLGHEQIETNGRRDLHSQNHEPPSAYEEAEGVTRWDKLSTQEPRRRRRRDDLGKLALTLLSSREARLGAIALVSVAVLGAGAAILTKWVNDDTKRKAAAAAPPPIDVLSAPSVDKFTRGFVANMLDFNPDTYRVSQIQAMAAMKPELLESYWRETNFPLSRRQLKAAPRGQTLMITRLSQQHLDASTKEVDVFAELVASGSKLSSPVHLKLKLTALNNGGQDARLQVIEQKDLTASESN